VHPGDCGECEGRPKQHCTGNPYGGVMVDLEQHHKENGRDLGTGVGFAEDARAEIAKSGDSIEHGAGGQDRDIAAEHHDRVFPRNLVEDGEHEKQGAQQKLVRDRVEILAKQGLLVETAREEAVKPIADSGQDEKDQSGRVVTVDQADHDEGQKKHAQHRQLVGRGEKLRYLHAGS
jgi:hypothetical protein